MLQLQQMVAPPQSSKKRSADVDDGGGSTAGKSPSSSSPPTRQRQSSMLIILIGVACFISAFVTMWQAHTTTLSQHHHPENLIKNTAIHAAMKDFLDSGRNDGTSSTRRAQQEESEGKSDGAGENNKEGGGGGDIDDDHGSTTNEKEEEDGDDDEEEEEEERQDSEVGEENNSGGDGDVEEEHEFGERPHSLLAGLSCKEHGGPNDDDSPAVQEMVYWSDIPSDEHYVSPFSIKHNREKLVHHMTGKKQERRYMTFEPDGGGWNNIRMALETTIGLAIAMGRTLVMPPAQRMYLLGKDRGKQKTDFHFADFFPLTELAEEHDGLEIISAQEFLETEAMTGNLFDKYTGEVSFPPDNRTNWDGHDIKPYKEWLRNVTLTPFWKPDKCMIAFPSSADHKDVAMLREMQRQIRSEGSHETGFLEDPSPVDGEPLKRMREHIAHRLELCVYDEEMQNAHIIHLMCYHKMRVRLLIHSYAFLYFEDWKEDVWLKRFIRDHIRYIDEIQCAAARVVEKIRSHVRDREGSGSSGEFDTFHIRRGDFQFKKTRIEAQQIYENTKQYMTPNTTVFIATDEHDMKFFDPLREHYDLLFLKDFIKTELDGVNTNYFGMIDQLIASRGRRFFGCWHSTFTGYINRIRGYHSQKDKSPGYEKGLLPNSYYYVPLDQQLSMHKYAALGGAFFNREFPTSWRDIDRGITEI